MSIVEDRIVAMKFDNRQFEAAVAVSVATLGLLKKSLNFENSSKDFSAIKASVDANNQALSGMQGVLDGVSSKFSIMGAIGFTAVQKVTDSVLGLAASTVRGALSGGLSRALKIEQARFQFKGLGQDVEASMAAALEAVDGTAYGLDAAAAVASQFGATGMEAGTEMTEALRGVAGMSTMTGRSFEEIGNIFTTVAGEGKLTTVRLNQFATRGVNAAAKLGEALGKTEGEVRKMVTNGEIDFRTFAGAMNDAFGEHATKANETYTGSVANMGAALSRIGADFHVPRLEAMRKIFNALTPVINQVRKGIEPLVEEFTKFVNLRGDGVVKLLESIDLSKMAGVVEPLSKGFFNLLNVVIDVVGTIKAAFMETFNAPPLQEMAEAFERFTQKLKMGGETADKLKRTFSGLFAIVRIAGSIIGGVVKVLFSLFGAAGGAAGGILDLTATVGDWLVSVADAISEGTLLTGFFGGLGAILRLPIHAFTLLIGVMTNVGGLMANLGGVAKATWGILARGELTGGIWDENSGVARALFKVRDALVWIGSAASQLWSILAKGKNIGGVFSEDSAMVKGMFKLRETLGEFFTVSNITKLLGAGAVGALALGIQKVLKEGIGIGVKGSEGVFESLKGMFDSVKGSFNGVTELFGSLTGALTTMQNNVKASIILKIAIAVGVLALSMKLLSTIDAGDLGKALGAMTIAFGELLAAMAILSKISGAAGFTKIPAIAVAMVALSVAILILSASVKVLSSLSWEELLKGLGGVAVLLGLVVAASLGLSKVEGPMMRTALALIPLAIALKILASAVKDFGEMSWSEMLQGMAGLAGALLILAGALRLMPTGMAAMGAGLALVGVGVSLVATAVGRFGSMSVEELAKGMVGLAGSLLILAGALRLMPPNMAMMGAGLLIVSIALQGVSTAVKLMSTMTWEEMAIGLIALGGALAILAIALTFMNGTLAGSAAMLIAAVALGMLIPPILILSAMSWQDLVMGLGALAGIFLVLGAAGVLLTPVVPILLGLGAALLLLGVGLGAAGLGAQAFVAALVAFVDLVTHSKNALVDLMDMIPQMAIKLAEGVIAFATTIAANTGKFVGAFKDLILALLDAIIEVAPKIQEALSTMLQSLLEVIVTNAPGIAVAFTVILQTFLTTVRVNAPSIINAIFDLMMTFLKTIRDRIPEVVTVVTDIIVTFIDSISRNLPRIVESAANLIITFVRSLADTIRNKRHEMNSAGLELALAIIDGMTGGLVSAVGRVATAAANMARNALQAAKDALSSKSPSKKFIKLGEDSGEGLKIGIENSFQKVAKAGSMLATGLLAGFSKGLGTEMPKVLDSVFKTLETGTVDAKFWGPNSPATSELKNMHNALKGLDFQLAEFYGEVNRADPKSMEEYAKTAGDSLKHLSGLFAGLKDAASTAFGMLAKGEGLDAVLGSEDVLSKILGGVLSLLPGVQGVAVSLGLAVVDGLLSVFMGPGTSVLGLVGDLLGGAVRMVAGFFGIKMPLKEKVEEGTEAMQDFLVTVKHGADRFEKVSEKAIKSMADNILNVQELWYFEDPEPTVTPVLDLTQFSKDQADMLSQLDTTSLSVAGSANRAASIHDMQQGLKDQQVRGSEPDKPTTIEFTQYNNSPKALSHAEIYRQTRGQLSLAKEALGV